MTGSPGRGGGVVSGRTWNAHSPSRLVGRVALSAVLRLNLNPTLNLNQLRKLAGMDAG